MFRARAFEALTISSKFRVRSSPTKTMISRFMRLNSNKENIQDISPTIILFSTFWYLQAKALWINLSYYINKTGILIKITNRSIQIAWFSFCTATLNGCFVWMSKWNVSLLEFLMVQFNHMNSITVYIYTKCAPASFDIPIILLPIRVVWFFVIPFAIHMNRSINIVH